MLDDLAWRNLIHQSTDLDELRRHLEEPGRRIYCGFDPTADSLTIGNLLPITLLLRVRRAGHVPVVLFGGATGQIGDPSFKAGERTLLDPEVAAANLARHRATITSYLETVDGPDPVFVDNLDWLGSMGMLEFLRDVGRYFSVNDLLRRDAIRDRIEGREVGLSFTEFSYALLQAYDFLHLFRNDDVTVQVGASDQWGNIVGGADLVRRVEGKSVHALTCPLLLKKDGTKFGKTESGAVWLSPDRMSPYAFYQFCVNLDDDMAPTFLRYYSLRPRHEIEALEVEQAADPSRRVAQRAIARELTARLHGVAALERAEQTTEAFFTGSVRDLDLAQIDDAVGDLPTATVTSTEVAAGIPVVDLLAVSGLASSKSEARRFVADGAVSVNGTRVGADASVGADDLLHESVVLLRRGKRRWGVVRVDDAARTRDADGGGAH
ncbi:MAG: tyrosine--tRNA ligase [Acidimicrobiia bacterium]|nr:tyrosine--tRNA ligase [Acidimicrobiia bacterium]